MTDEKLAAIRARYETIHASFGWPEKAPIAVRDIIDAYDCDVPALLAEVERLREIVEKVAQLEAVEIGFKRDVVLHSDTINVLWVKEKAKEALQ